ncbi:hypothetical protein [Aliikangiella sp. G2MR2-5]|uniref:hypothetical protein n=1 Tax=Aliikangiella sp. G2MR2-5 TaxID=2788943 RepID=UPI0018ABD0B1|nr:hypothetical protein [Aliikangiella sp. G2MR2-5]
MEFHISSRQGESARFSKIKERQASLPSKRWHIEEASPLILQRLNLNRDAFVRQIQKEVDLSRLSIIGSPINLVHYIENKRMKFLRGNSIAKQLYG